METLRTVAVFVRPGVLPLELGIAHQLFGAARGSAGEPLYDVVTCALEPGPLRTCADFEIHVPHGSQTLADADIVVIPAADGDPRPEEGVGEALRKIRPGTRLASICTGSFVLAAAGLLTGRKATTHWRSVAEFRRLYPEVDLDPDVLYTDDGDILTSAGEAAGIDLCLHIIRRDHGAAIANDVARRVVVAPHREGGQAQFIQRPVPNPQTSSTGTARSWALRHLDRPVSLRELAAQESTSVRTFTRRFKEEVGLSPAQWLIQQRVERARKLLEETDLPVDRIAADAGFGTAASLRQHLLVSVGVSPTAYRTTFRGPA